MRYLVIHAASGARAPDTIRYAPRARIHLRAAHLTFQKNKKMVDPLFVVKCIQTLPTGEAEEVQVEHISLTPC